MTTRPTGACLVLVTQVNMVHGEREGSPRGGFTSSARGDKRPSSLSRLDFWRDAGTTTLTKG